MSTRRAGAGLLAAPQPNQPPPMTDIRVMNADGTGDRAILANTVFSVEPQWSVNGQLVFMSPMNGSKLDIYVINVDGTGLRRLTSAAGNKATPCGLRMEPESRLDPIARAETSSTSSP